MSTAVPRQTKTRAGLAGRSLSLQAVPREDTAAMESLMAGDVDVNAVTSTGMTPLITAAAHGHLGTVRALLKRGAAVNQKRHDGFTALTLAAFFGHEHVVRELLSQGADFNSEDKSGTSAERWAELRNFRKISELLRQIRERAGLNSAVSVPVSESVPLPTSHKPPPEERVDLDLVPSETVPLSAAVVAPPAPQASPTHQEKAVCNETTISRQQIPPKAVSEDLDDLGFPEGAIRRVGGGKPAIASITALENKVETVGEFSPLSVLGDRLTASWKHLLIVVLALVLLSGLIALASVKAIVRKAKPVAFQAVSAASALPAESKASASLSSQPAVPPADSQTRSSVEVSAVEGTASPIQPGSLDTATRASHSGPTISQDFTSGRADSPETKRRGSKRRVQNTSQPASEDARSPHATRHRSESITSDNDVVRNGSTQLSEPAAIKIVSEPPAKQLRKASPAKDTQPQSTAPLEGSSTKRKVIQWP